MDMSGSFCFFPFFPSLNLKGFENYQI
uniref:Uncharacterized protein n=1 Tax=Rhizophora mucronata TaxID=61149 RepID=A0A2P2NT52_RHIMU